MKVLIVGLRGLGVECAKNLILAGPASVDIFDPTIVKINDMGSNFYIKEEHVGKVSRANASID
jgi:ubiquitin-activating enzyme E1